MQGVIIRNTGSRYQVRTGEGHLFDCTIKGNFRIKEINSTNPVAVGDRVFFDVVQEGEGVIYDIEDRKNYIVRKPSNLSKQVHIIAANIDQVLVVLTINYPKISTVFLDRILATCEAYHVSAKLIINKTDLYSDEELEYLKALCLLYENIGYECLSVSTINRQGLDRMAQWLKGKVSLLAGHSGVGKSSLINAIFPQFTLRTGEISAAHNKGTHTTTFSEMIDAGENSFIIDTPGIKGFGTINFQREETGHFFPEIFAISKKCRFTNCTHVHEPGCAVLRAVAEQRISQSRYRSYLSILEDVGAGKYR